MGSCALPLHSPVPHPLLDWGPGPLWLQALRGPFGFHLIKLCHNENSHNEINFNYLSAANLKESLHY